VSGHVLVIGVDGTRFDALSADATPAIWAADVLTPITIDDATPSWSGPCWANIATGVPVDQHGVTGNDLSGHQLATHPDFLTVATRAGFSTLLAVAGWPPLATDEDGGPLFAEVSRREFVEASEGDGMAAWDVADGFYHRGGRAAGVVRVPRRGGYRGSPDRRWRGLPCRRTGRRPAGGAVVMRGFAARRGAAWPPRRVRSCPRSRR